MAILSRTVSSRRHRPLVALALAFAFPGAAVSQGPPSWLWSFVPLDPPAATAFSPDTSLVAKATPGFDVTLHDTVVGDPIRILSGHAGWVNSVAFSPDGNLVVTGSNDRTVKVWEAATGNLRFNLTGHSAKVNVVAFSPDGTRIVSGASDRTIRIWNAATGTLVRVLGAHADPVLTLAYSPDGSLLASGSTDTTIRIHVTADWSLIRTLIDHFAPVSSLAFSPDGGTLASGSWDRRIKLWDVPTWQVRATIAAHDDWVESLAFTANGTRLASASLDGTVKVWDAADGTLKRLFDSGIGYALGLTISPDANFIGIAGETSGVARNPFGPPDRPFPVSFQVLRGRIDRGDVTSLRGDDAQPLRICRFIVPNDPLRIIQVRYDGVTITPDPSALRLQVRSRSTVGGLIQQTVELFDFDANRFDPVDVFRGNIGTAFSTVTVDATGDVGRYVSARTVRAQQTIRIVGPVPNPNVCVETSLVRWTLTP